MSTTTGKPEGALSAPLVDPDLVQLPSRRPAVDRDEDDVLAVSRRGFFGLAGAAALTTTLGGCIRKPREMIVPYADRPEDLVPGDALHFATSAYLGGEVLGLLVESQDGRPTKIYGNPNHPASTGGIPASSQAEVMRLWDADRSRAPSEGGTKTTYAAFKAAFGGAVAGDGAGAALLLERDDSPTLARLVGELRAKKPRIKVYVHDGANPGNGDAGATLAGLGAVRGVRRFGKARVIVALDDDFLMSGPDRTRAAREWAAGRDVDHGGKSNRLYAVEPAFTSTGATADNRLRLPASRIGLFLAGLAAKVVEGGARAPAGGEALLSSLRGAQLTEVEAKWAAAIAKDLVAHRGASLVTVGERQPPEVHALAWFVNLALGNVGSTVELAPRGGFPADGGLGDLISAMNGGSVRTLVVLGGNPVYTAPGDLDFAAALGKVETSIHLSDRMDETSVKTTWHVPQAHWLTTWGDTRAVDGTVAVQQPIIAPLWDGLSAIELLALLVGGPKTDGWSLVRATHAGAGGADFERRWNRWLHDGVVADSAAIVTYGAPLPGEAPAAEEPLAAGEGTAEVAPEEGAEAAPPEPVQPAGPPVLAAWGGVQSAWKGSAPVVSADALELDFYLDPNLVDGRYANVGWMLELPDPMTKLSWDNAAEISPATARRLGVKMGDLLAIEVGGRRMQIPAFVAPGTADEVVVLKLGWGRSAGGTYANGAGFDVSALKAGVAGFATGAKVSRALGSYELVTTQDHGRLDPVVEVPLYGPVTYSKRPMAVEVDLDTYKHDVAALSGKKDHGAAGAGGDHGGGHAEKPGADDPKFLHDAKAIPLLPPKSLWEEPNVRTGQQWGMSIDLNSCIGCNSCTVACNAENNISVVGKERVARGREMHWIRLDRYYTGEDEDSPTAVLQPLGCAHCETAPCEGVCPVAATSHSPEGLNDMAYNRCIGTRYCANNCPFKVRRFNYFNFSKENDRDNPLIAMQRNPNVTVRFRGVMEKCTYCVQRVNAAKIDAKVRGDGHVEDGALVTACQQVCPTGAIVFGDLRDEGSRVAARRKSPRDYVLLNDLNIHPRTSFLARVRNPNPELA